MTGAPAAVLLDTCAVIWLANGDPLPTPVLDAILTAGARDGVFVSPISAWEVGMLSQARGGRPAIVFLPDPRTWFAKVMAAPGIRAAALTGDIAVDASYLPDLAHGDPADRLLLATARHLGVPLVTRDTRIIAYARHGHVQVIPC